MWSPTLARNNSFFLFLFIYFSIKSPGHRCCDYLSISPKSNDNDRSMKSDIYSLHILVRRSNTTCCRSRHSIYGNLIFTINFTSTGQRQQTVFNMVNIRWESYRAKKSTLSNCICKNCISILFPQCNAYNELIIICKS